MKAARGCSRAAARSWRLLSVVCAMVASLGVSACSSSSTGSSNSAQTIDAIDLGDYSRKVTTKSPEAQRHFDQGLRWMYSFNHDEAVKSFRRALEADGGFAMAYWGVAICRGPHINNPTMDEASSKEAWSAITAANVHAPTCTPVEQALIAALLKRYVDPWKTSPVPMDMASRAPLDRAYADAMRAVHEQFPQDDDVATLYAEALMDLRPWDLWSLSGEARPETPAVLAALETVLARNPNHPGANHYYIHAVEASLQPERADAAATRLRTLVPGSGHMVHMPAHIDVRMGRWNLAADQNEHAMKVHDRYVRVSPRQGLYRAYMFHNEHFLAYACMMAGRQKDAVKAARGMVASIPEDFYASFGPVADAYTSIEVEALIRFGLWDEVLREPEPRESLPINRAMWRFARGVAFAAKGEVSSARQEQKLFREAVKRVPAGAMMAINPAEKVLAIADSMLEGEIRYREGDIDGAVTNLNAAIAIEDTLQYMEPPDWVQPVRHTLGAVLLDSGRAKDAEAVYREDLRRWPENGWSLAGLARCLRASDRADEARAVEARLDKAWSRADVEPTSSCFCVKHK